ncbi:hypothetical protein PVL29_018342 [Vitis rotundifolia]|uniref:Uncharacterized protein n=1 Tax=Vitis rotundifolia TaxID=103349 RepID=A0AA39DFS5_VITRO|nr:hypothetical protein PVL29_018342 [Vitis rotundifolia]
MRDFPSCFGENGVQVANLTSSGVSRSTTQNLVTCICSCKLGVKPYFIIITWSKRLCKFDIKPWLFTKRKVSKSSEINSIQFLLLGDTRKEAFKKTNVTLGFYNVIFITKKEHIFGKKLYGTKAQFRDNDQNHNLSIECDTIDANNPFLATRIDSKMVMQVKHLRWGFGEIRPS